MKSLVGRAKEMLEQGLDWSEHGCLSGEFILCSFWNQDDQKDEIWVVDMENAGCSPSVA